MQAITKQINNLDHPEKFGTRKGGAHFHQVNMPAGGNMPFLTHGGQGAPITYQQGRQACGKCGLDLTDAYAALK